MTQQPAPVLVDKQELHRSQEAALEKRCLEQLMKTSAALSSGQALPDVLQRILQGIQAVGFDRVRLYFLLEDGRFLEGVAEAGMDVDFIGFRLPRYDDRLLIALTFQTPPQIIKRVRKQAVIF